MIRRAAWALVGAAAFVLARGCGGSKSCASNGDCGNDVCSFAIGDCSGKGTCASWDNQCEGAPTQVCGCNGTTVEIACGYPASAVPAQSTGACAVPTGTACATADDCDPRAMCAFPIAAGCSATGTCVAPDISCTQDGPTMCGCDGTLVGGSCLYGAGNAAAPVKGPGVCGGVDAGADSGSDAPGAD